MLLEEMLYEIRHRLKSECFSDLIYDTGLASSTLWKWRKAPPKKPNLKVFCILAHYCGLNPTIDQLDELF